MHNSATVVRPSRPLSLLPAGIARVAWLRLALLLGGSGYLATTVLWTVVTRVTTMPAGNGWIDAYAYLDAVRALFTAPTHLYDPARTQLATAYAQRAFLYPPSGLLPFIPLQPIANLFGTAAAASVWVVIDCAALLTALLLFCRRLHLSAGTTVTVLVTGVCFGPGMLELASGQVNGVLLLLAALACRDAGRRREALWLGLAVAIKPVAPVLLLIPLLRGRWRATAGAVIIAAALNAALLPFAGFANEWFYVTQFLPYLGAAVTNDVNNLSLSNAFQLFIGGAAPHGQAVSPLHAAAVATIAAAVARLAITVAVMVAIRRASSEALAVALALAVVPLVAATAWAHYYLLLLPLLCVALGRLRPLQRWALCATVAALAWNGQGGTFWITTQFGAGTVRALLFIALCWCSALTAVGRVALQRAGRRPDLVEEAA